eukprot:CAMPEP_0117451518 /NCGR_PEP_ID=MMETSP0759-20121206/9052_1 /TAXON_ID=63605 /ORGANISM="Percolomonas cosmopolitus, Strain WS" /LENGTH=841 /DNA_ID=CAMNT_0005244127 /DNA_START=148 /DNA_END=2673 /DNA_ORIENTATION=+
MKSRKQRKRASLDTTLTNGTQRAPSVQIPKSKTLNDFSRRLSSSSTHSSRSPPLDIGDVLEKPQGITSCAVWDDSTAPPHNSHSTTVPDHATDQLEHTNNGTHSFSDSQVAVLNRVLAHMQPKPGLPFQNGDSSQHTQSDADTPQLQWQELTNLNEYSQVLRQIHRLEFEPATPSEQLNKSRLLSDLHTLDSLFTQFTAQKTKPPTKQFASLMQSLNKRAQLLTSEIHGDHLTLLEDLKNCATKIEFKAKMSAEVVRRYYSHHLKTVRLKLFAKHAELVQANASKTSLNQYCRSLEELLQRHGLPLPNEHKNATTSAHSPTLRDVEVSVNFIDKPVCALTHATAVQCELPYLYHQASQTTQTIVPAHVQGLDDGASFSTREFSVLSTMRAASADSHSMSSSTDHPPTLSLSEVVSPNPASTPTLHTLDSDKLPNEQYQGICETSDLESISAPQNIAIADTVSIEIQTMPNNDESQTFNILRERLDMEAHAYTEARVEYETKLAELSQSTPNVPSSTVLESDYRELSEQAEKYKALCVQLKQELLVKISEVESTQPEIEAQRAEILDMYDRAKSEKEFAMRERQRLQDEITNYQSIEKEHKKNMRDHRLLVAQDLAQLDQRESALREEIENVASTRKSLGDYLEKIHLNSQLEQKLTQADIALQNITRGNIENELQNALNTRVGVSLASRDVLLNVIEKDLAQRLEAAQEGIQNAKDQCVQTQASALVERELPFVSSQSPNGDHTFLNRANQPGTLSPAANLTSNPLPAFPVGPGRHVPHHELILPPHLTTRESRQPLRRPGREISFINRGLKIIREEQKAQQLFMDEETRAVLSEYLSRDL